MASSRRQIFAIAALVLAALAACSREMPVGGPGDRVERLGDEIVVAGQLFHTGTRVVLWTDPDGYDAYRTEPRFPGDMKPEALAKWKWKPSFSPLREHVGESVKRRVAERGWTLEEVQDAVDLFVMHFDVCGTSRRCFRVLHDDRFLSVHFMLDVDGTIYQTLDVKERAYHAREANDRSIGVEIAHIGAYSRKDDPILRTWYGKSGGSTVLRFPKEAFPSGTGILREYFEPKPARDELLSGKVHGKNYFQYDFTAEQYHALARLVATIHRVLPRIAIDAPRDREGNVLQRAMPASELARWSGLVGHHHVTDEKIDPGPAFDWDRVIGESRALAREQP